MFTCAEGAHPVMPSVSSSMHGSNLHSPASYPTKDTEVFKCSNFGFADIEHNVLSKSEGRLLNFTG